MASKDATVFELNVSLQIELDDDARTDLVAEIQKEWKLLLHQTSMKILSLNNRDDGLRSVKSRVKATPSLEELTARREARIEDEGVAPVLELVPELDVIAPVVELHAS